MDLKKLVFFDIETAPLYKTYEELPENLKLAWESKFETLYGKPEGTAAENYFNCAGLHAEFSKVVCISVGILRESKDGSGLILHVNSYHSHDESQILKDFNAFINKCDLFTVLVGHNIKQFDVPYLGKRFLINGMKIPKILQVNFKKSWDLVQFYDTKEFWNFGNSYGGTSLKIICACFNIPTPKDDIEGKDVGRVYWMENDLDRIQRYCKKDVIAVANVFFKYNNLETNFKVSEI